MTLESKYTLFLCLSVLLTLCNLIVLAVLVYFTQKYFVELEESKNRDTSLTNVVVQPESTPSLSNATSIQNSPAQEHTTILEQDDLLDEEYSTFAARVNAANERNQTESKNSTQKDTVQQDSVQKDTVQKESAQVMQDHAVNSSHQKEQLVEDVTLATDTTHHVSAQSSSSKEKELEPKQKIQVEPKQHINEAPFIEAKQNAQPIDGKKTTSFSGHAKQNVTVHANHSKMDKKNKRMKSQDQDATNNAQFKVKASYYGEPVYAQIKKTDIDLEPEHLYVQINTRKNSDAHHDELKNIFAYQMNNKIRPVVTQQRHIDTGNETQQDKNPLEDTVYSDTLKSENMSSIHHENAQEHNQLNDKKELDHIVQPQENVTAQVEYIAEEVETLPSITPSNSAENHIEPTQTQPLSDMPQHEHIAPIVLTIETKVTQNIPVEHLNESNSILDSISVAHAMDIEPSESLVVVNEQPSSQHVGLEQSEVDCLDSEHHVAKHGAADINHAPNTLNTQQLDSINQALDVSIVENEHLTISIVRHEKEAHALDIDCLNHISQQTAQIDNQVAKDQMAHDAQSNLSVNSPSHLSVNSQDIVTTLNEVEPLYTAQTKLQAENYKVESNQSVNHVEPTLDSQRYLRHINAYISAQETAEDYSNDIVELMQKNNSTIETNNLNQDMSLQSIQAKQDSKNHVDQTIERLQGKLHDDFAKILTEQKTSQPSASDLTQLSNVDSSKPVAVHDLQAVVANAIKPIDIQLSKEEYISKITDTYNKAINLYK